MKIYRCPHCETDMGEDELLTVETYKVFIEQPSRIREFEITATDEDNATSMLDGFMKYGFHENDVEEVTDSDIVAVSEGYTLSSINVIEESERES